MRRFSKIFQGCKYAVLIAALLPLSCATILHPAKDLPKLDENNSIIFGKVEFWKNNKPMINPSEGALDFDPFLASHVSHYVSDALLNRNTFVAGEYAFKVKPFKDGYFAYAIPPGRYYFVEFDYCYLFETKPALCIRTYMFKNSPFLVSFDVPTNKAAYIGTIRHNFCPQYDTGFYFKSIYSIECTNDFTNAMNWFLKSNSRFQTNVVEATCKINGLLH